MAVSWVAACAGAGGLAGDAAAGPAPRSGHTFTTLAGGETHVLFGGSGQGSGSAKGASALSDVHICRVAPADGAVTWAPLAVEGPAPPPRARHSAVALDAKRLLIFGGLDQKTRYNDCWVLDASTRRWSAASVAGDPPPPRAHHTGAQGWAYVGACSMGRVHMEHCLL